MIYLAVDFGDARTGIAVCDSSEFLASPLTVIHETDSSVCAKKIAELARERRADCLVVGFPKNMDGSVGPRAQLCLEFANQLKECVDLPVAMWDERCTTVAAHRALNVTNTRGKKRKAVVDAVAATMILESCLGFLHNGGVLTFL